MGFNSVNLRQFAAKAFALIFFMGMLSLAMGVAFADDRVSESDLFGSSATPTAAKPMEEGKPAGAKSSKSVLEQNLQIGGSLSTQADVFFQEGVPLSENSVSNPNILFLYLDSKLDEQDNRVFARIRTFYDPTGLSGGTPGLAGLSNPYGFGTGTNENLQVSLQELRLSTNLDHKVFLTIGRQKVKYGTGKFFNPTDFLNSQPFNFFLPSDERPGVDMIKAHIPSGTANLYMVGMTGNPSSGNPSGGYFRGELGYDKVGDLLSSGEISISGFLPRGQNGKAGFDISQAVGDLDVYFEGAWGQDAAGAWKDATTVGATWDIRYDDRSSNTVSLQAEHFQVGPYAEYGVFSVYLPGPGTLKDITFVESNLFSFIDQSGLSRLDTVCQFTPQIAGRVYASGHWGSTGGVFHLAGQVAEAGTRLDVSF